MKPHIISSLILGSVIMVSSAYAAPPSVSTSWDPEKNLIAALLGPNSGITIVPGSVEFHGNKMYQAGVTSDGRITLSSGSVISHTPEWYYKRKLEGGKMESGPDSYDDPVAVGLAELAGVTPNKVRDMAVLTFSFKVNDPSLNTVSTSFVFATDEYASYNASLIDPLMYVYGDVFGFFVDGVNYAKLPDGSSVNARQVDYFTDGENSYGYAGKTEQYSIVAQLDPSRAVHTISIAVADIDTFTYLYFPDYPRPVCGEPDVGWWYDSAVFLGPLSFSNTPAVPEPETWAMMLAGLGLIGAVAHHRRKGR